MLLLCVGEHTGQGLEVLGGLQKQKEACGSVAPERVVEGSLEGESTAAAQEQVLRQIQEEKLEGNDSKLQLDWTLVHHNVLMLVH